jgi:hypothetical protein
MEVMKVRFHIRQRNLDSFVSREIPKAEAQIDDLSQHRGKGCTEHPPMKTEDKHSIQNYIGDTAGKHGKHGKFWGTVGADEGTHSTAQNGKRKAPYQNASVFQSVGGVIRGCPKQIYQWNQKNGTDGKKDNSDKDQPGNGVICTFLCFF